MKSQIMYIVLAFIVSAILGKIIIPILKKLKVGQSERKEGPASHLRKKGTPTMGGVIIICTMIIFSVIVCIQKNDYRFNMPLLAIFLSSLGFGLIGFIDDYKKVVLKNTDGISPKQKMFGLLLVSTTYVIFLYKYLNTGTDIIIPFTKINIILPYWFYIPFTILVMLATTNAVNLTDGVDGLAGSICSIIFVAISIVAFKYSEDAVSLFGAIMAGSTVGFLIYNFYKAKVMMGDTGSLLLGGAISAMLIYLKNPLLLVILAIVPVIETMSVIIQVIYFKKTGKRLFKMTPIHHHFELSGWRENKVVAVFSCLTFISSIICILYA